MSLSDTISIIALGVSLAATLFAALAASNAANRDLRTAIYTSATEMILEIDRLLLDFPEGRAYLYEHKDLSVHDPERGKVLAIVEFVLDSSEYIWHHKADFPESEDRKMWSKWLQRVFESSPALSEYLKSNADWYPHLKNFVERGDAGEG